MAQSMQSIVVARQLTKRYRSVLAVDGVDFEVHPAECFGWSFVRMDYQRTFDAIIATPVSLDDVITGEILWGVTRGLISGIAVLLMAILFRLVPSPLAPLSLLFSLVGGFTFASLAMVFTALSPSINFFNYAYTQLLAPMFLFSGVFFPISRLPDFAQTMRGFRRSPTWLCHRVPCSMDKQTRRCCGTLSGSLCLAPSRFSSRCC